MFKLYNVFINQFINYFFCYFIILKITKKEIVIRKDNRPYWLKKLATKINKIYVRHFLKPQFKYLGKGGAYFKPRYIKVFGNSVYLDDYPTLIGASDANIQFTSWNIGDHQGEIIIGKYSLITPGVRIMAAEKIEIGDACMIAHGAYISDADWHGIYDRAKPVGRTKPINIKDNVWIGDSVIICKGVTIGKNSIIGAGSVVTKDVPENCIYAGNPAKFIKILDEKEFNTRKEFFNDPKKLAHDFDMLDKYSLKNNTILNWIKSLIYPDNSQ